MRWRQLSGQPHCLLQSIHEAYEGEDTSAYSPFDLSGKVALVTGGNSGIGLGMAQAMAQAGADIAIWGTNVAKNAAAAETLKATGRKILTLQCDVGEEAAVDAAFARTLEEFGRIDGCFANAGVSGRGGHTFLEMTSAEWHRVTRINLDGAFYTFRAAARHMVERGGGGVLVGTASLAAIEAAPRSEHYAATKGGIISMVRAMAVEFARYSGVSCDPAGLDRDEHDGECGVHGWVQDQGAAAGADAPLG